MKLTDIKCKTKEQENVVEQLKKQTQYILNTKWKNKRDAYDEIFVECDVLAYVNIYSDTAFYDSVRDYQRALLRKVNK